MLYGLHDYHEIILFLLTVNDDSLNVESRELSVRETWFVSNTGTRHWTDTVIT